MKPSLYYYSIIIRVMLVENLSQKRILKIPDKSLFTGCKCRFLLFLERIFWTLLFNICVKKTLLIY